MSIAVAPHAADDHNHDALEAEIRALLSDTCPVRTPSPAEIDAMFARQDAGLAVLEAARDWRRNYGNTNFAYADACDRLTRAVDEFDAAAEREESIRKAAPGPPGTRHSAERPPVVGRDRNAAETGSEGRETRGRSDG